MTTRTGRFPLRRPDVADPTYEVELPDECRRLANLTPEETAIAANFAQSASRTQEWR